MTVLHSEQSSGMEMAVMNWLRDSVCLLGPANPAHKYLSPYCTQGPFSEGFSLQCCII